MAITIVIAIVIAIAMPIAIVIAQIMAIDNDLGHVWTMTGNVGEAGGRKVALFAKIPPARHESGQACPSPLHVDRYPLFSRESNGCTDLD